MKLILMIMMIFLFLGCSEKIIYIKPKPYKFQTIPQPEKRKIIVYAYHKELYEAYILNFRAIIDFQNNQIADYYKDFNTTKAINE